MTVGNDLRLVVFDVDGTLIDSQENIIEGMRRTFVALGLPPLPREQVLSIVGLSLNEAIARLMPDLSPSQIEQGADLYRQSFVSIRAEKGETAAPLYPGAMAVLQKLAEDDFTLLGVATGKSRRGLEHAYRAHGIGEIFVTSQTADDHPSKPNPSMLHRCLSDTGADPRRAVMIGDTSFDIEMGRAAGFRTIGVTWGYHPVSALRQAGADILVDDFHAVPGAIEELVEVSL